MAFQQPTRQNAPRAAGLVPIQDGGVVVPPRPLSAEREAEGSQTWVLFSAPTDITTVSYLTESQHSLETPGRSRLSDLGSLNTVARSEQASDAGPLSVLSADHQDGDDDTELDSLDSHLPDFRSLPGLNISQGGHHTGPLYPSHDGLGSFRLDRPAIGIEAEDQIYRFEKFNPRKVRRRLDSLGNSHLNIAQVFPQQEEKRQRIEAWRLEHSRVLLEDEVQREARRRQKSFASMHRSNGTHDGDTDKLSWHDEDAIEFDGNPESLVARITRRIVHDFFGIDDKMLSILLGEALPADIQGLSSSTPHGSQSGSQPISGSTDHSSWQISVLERVSRELGLLVNHFSPHPGAFSTYSVVQCMALPCAGLPVIPESSDAGVAGVQTEPNRTKTSPAVMPEFQPTMSRQHKSTDRASREQGVDEQSEDIDVAGGHFSREEWERSLDIKLVFRYLASRFASRSKASPQSSATHDTTPTQQENAAKAARIRQHHPLIARTRPVERRAFRVATPTSPVGLRHQSSCASRSTKQSARRSSCSSRHYWDIGGSLGTGSVIASTGPMGSWGEV